MFALLARIIGASITNPAVRGAAQQIYKKYGAKFLTNFFKNVQNLNVLSKDEILNLANAEFSKQSGRLFADTTRSGAKRFSDLINRGIDDIERRVRQHVENYSLRVMKQRHADALGDQNLFKMLGQPLGGPKGFTGKQHSKAYTKARGLASDTLESILFPQSRGSAFAGGFLRGLSGETLSRATHRLIEVVISTPKIALTTPKYRLFYRTLMSEVRYLQSVGEATSARKLHFAIKTAYKRAGQMTPSTQGLMRYTIAGSATGRITGVIGAEYIWTSREERNKNVESFKRSVRPYIKKQTRYYVESYTRSDGTRVKGHYRRIAA